MLNLRNIYRLFNKNLSEKYALKQYIYLYIQFLHLCHRQDLRVNLKSNYNIYRTYWCISTRPSISNLECKSE